MKLIETATAEKLRGGFYTPEPIAHFVLRWGMDGLDAPNILEPSCGDGVFLRELSQSGLPYEQITAVEFDPIEASIANEVPLARKEVINTDFHLFCTSTPERFDLVVGNPPYIRYQYFEEAQQELAKEIFQRAGLKYSKLTNAWVSFVVGASLLLKERGKIGMVVPAELLQVSYAQQLREFLSHFYNKINIISFEKLVFPIIQQEVVLLLCEKDGTDQHRIDHLELRDASQLQELDTKTLHRPSKRIDFKSNKWTYYFLEQDEIDLLEKVSTIHKIPTIGDYAKVEIGITTGANDYFTIPAQVVVEYNLQDFSKRMVGRSVQVNSLLFTQADWEMNRNKGAKAHLLVVNEGEDLKAHSGLERYIALGESHNMHKGYKTGIRKEWWVIPGVRSSQALFIRRNNLYPKLIINQAAAYTTDTMHRVTPKAQTDLNALTASYYNSLSLAFAEVSGRSHGGGVLELMPSEAERILLPYDERNLPLLKTIDEMMRKGQTIQEILTMTDQIILKKHLGLTDKEIGLANGIWKKLSQRRLNRGK